MSFEIYTSYNNGNTDILKALKNLTNYVPYNSTFCFDFTHFYEVTPFNTLVLSNAVRDYIKKYPITNFTYIPKGQDDFLGHIGFYDSFGGRSGKKIGEAQATSNYVPIRKIVLSDFGDFYSNIENEANALANLLGYDSKLKNFVKYIFIETIRNVFEHANTDSLYICAQKWPSKNELEFAIVDYGCGISAAMRPSFPYENEKRLLYLAAEPGVSAKSNYRYTSEESGWRNSGYGLYLLRKLAVAYKGSFLLCSGNFALYQDRCGVKEYDTVFDGTAISIRFKTDCDINFEETRKSIVKEGEERAHTFKTRIYSASKSSGGIYNDKDTY